MKMKMVFKYRSNNQLETHNYRTKKECNAEFDNVLRNRRDEIKCVWIGPEYGPLERIDLKTREEIRSAFYMRINKEEK